MFLTQILRLINTLLETVSPLIRYLLEALLDILSALWEGAKDMLDNWKSLLFVFTVGALSAYGAIHYQGDTNCKSVIKQLHRDYTFVPKKKDKVTHPQHEWWRIF